MVIVAVTVGVRVGRLVWVEVAVRVAGEVEEGCRVGDAVGVSRAVRYTALVLAGDIPDGKLQAAALNNTIAQTSEQKRRFLRGLVKVATGRILPYQDWMRKSAHFLWEGI